MTIRINLPKAVRRAGRRRWSKASLRRVQLVLDGAAIVLGLTAFFQVGHTELALHGVWIIMAVQGFLFGLRFVLLRIAVVTFAIFAHPVFAGPSPSVVGLELFESQVMTIVAIIIAIMADRLASNSRRYARLYREASDRLLTAQEDERLRLARDIHDGVGQTLAALTFTLDAAESMLWTGERKHLTLTRAAVARAQELAGIAIDETRDVAFRLRPARFAQTGLGAGIQELAATAGVAVDVRIDPDLIHPRLLAPDDEMEVYRIVQEALGNATRYALADHIWIAMDAEDRRLRVTVRDDGIGFDPDGVGERGLGLPGMSERAFLLRADLEIRSARGAGTTITLTLPLPAAAAASQPVSTPRLTSTETVAAQ